MATQLVTADTSVVIPLLSRWHEAHTGALEAAGLVRRLPAYVLLEAVAALTSLPRGLAVRTDLAVQVLRSRFPDPPLTLDADGYGTLIESLGPARVRGGQVFDALIAASAKGADALLLTRDRRAESTYRAVGVETRFLD